ncbi:MAG: hypothetical protein HeimC3_17940 [Candidatus Heimdallarchaeota archaeon LC_3]|nr:MAG: hypothetical protein HeimC3_17940 [Candidatus Heimdallarchaeota archaeon LC_3]
MINSEVKNIQQSFEYSFQNRFDKINISTWKIIKRFKLWVIKYKMIKRKFNLDHYMAFLASLNTLDDF